MKDNSKSETKQEKLEPVVKQVVPNQSGKKNKSIFGFIKDLIAPNNESEEIKNIEKEISTEKSFLTRKILKI